MGYRQPNRTKTFFQQVGANRPEAARQKLGSAMGAQSVLQGQTGAQQKENVGVQQAQQGVTQQTAQGQQSISGTPMLTQAQGALGAAATAAGQTPILQTGIRGGGTGTLKGGKYVDDGTLAKQAQGVTALNAATLKDVYGNIDTAQKGLTGFSADKLSAEVGSQYGKASDALSESEKAMTEGNLGKLAAESAFEKEQADLAQVLADRQSNIGKLKSLYGVGYDTGKYGALDSNLLQGQLNEAATQSGANLAEREKARASGDVVRQSYLDNIDTSRGALAATKSETDAKVSKLNDEIAAAQTKLNELRARTDKAGKDAAAALQKSLDAKTKEKQKFQTDKAAKAAAEAKKKSEAAVIKEAKKVPVKIESAIDRLNPFSERSGPGKTKEQVLKEKAAAFGGSEEIAKSQANSAIKAGQELPYPEAVADKDKRWEPAGRNNNYKGRWVKK